MDGSTNHREYRKKNISFHSKVSSLHYDLTKEISINPIIPRIILAFPDECPFKILEGHNSSQEASSLCRLLHGV